ncbi:lipopolysaccharide biosynthesis protein [uncultured Thiohalocapsa sp.]|uniref:lipopolysaccharide biosynthesis protein n=1 Tax=uncultured Thiohalocapsa sp. TaxID=768990 RepID=UPI0025FF7344|nr:lipopolysaccharide biosynthesis protein [uncultured Thiohalocapsa sp.]
MNTANFSRQVRLGAAWTYANQVYVTIGQFVIGIVLARLLGPSEFGIFIAVTAFTTLFILGVKFGVPQAIVQARSLTDEQVNAAFWSICVLAAVFMGMAVLIAEPLSAVYGTARFASVMYLMSGIFVLMPFSAVALALLRREMRFDQVAVLNIVTLTVAAPFSIGAALLGAGAYSLVLSAFVSSLVNLVILMRFTRWRPGWPSLAPVRGLVGYSSFATVNNVLALATQRVDNMLVGALLGTTQLGLYNRAFSLARIPSDQFAESLGPLVMGSLSRIQDDIGWSRQLFFKAISAIAVVTMPLFVVLGVAGPDAIELIYGSAWAAAGHPLQAMVVGAVFLMLSVTLISFVNAQGLVRQAASVHLGVLLVTIVGVLVLAPWGLMAIAIGISLREILFFVLLVRLLRRSRIALGFTELGHAVAPAMIAATLACLAGLLARGPALEAFGAASFGLLVALCAAVFGAYAVAVGVLMLAWRSHVPLANTRLQIFDAVRALFARLAPRARRLGQVG